MYVKNNDKKRERVTKPCVADFPYSLKGGIHVKGLNVVFEMA
jgi:hypothetical protein